MTDRQSTKLLAQGFACSLPCSAMVSIYLPLLHKFYPESGHYGIDLFLLVPKTKNYIG